MVGRSIPRTRPVERFRLELGWPGPLPLLPPVVGGGLLVLVKVHGDERVALAVFDARRGELVFETRLPGVVDATTPALDLARGRILVAGWHHRDVIDAFVIGLDGELRAILVGRSVNPGPASLRALPGFGDDVLLTWSDDPSVRTQCLRDGRDEPVWEAPEWLLGTIGEVAILADAEKLYARRVADGRDLWSRYHENVEPVLGAGALFLVDRSRRAYNVLTRDEMFLRPRGLDAVTADRESEYQEYLRTHRLFARVEIACADPSSSVRQWAVEVDGDATSLLAAPHALCVTVAGEDGRGRIERWTRDGAALGGSDVAAPPHRGWPPRSDDWPRLVAADHTFLLWASETELVCEPLADPGSVAWRMPLPEPGTALPDRPLENDLLRTAAIRVEEGAVYLRAGTKLWCFAE